MNRDNLSHAIQQNLKRLPAPFEAHYGVVPPPPPVGLVDIESALPKLRQVNSAMERVNIFASELSDPWLVNRILPRREAISSSAIEGTNSTLDELLSSEETEDSETTEATKQVRDYALALDAYIPKAKQDGHSIFTTNLVSNLHRSVMQGNTSYSDIPGDLRNCVVWIGGGRDIAYSTYNPTPPADIELCLEQSMHYMRCEGDQLNQQHLITRMAIAHAHFEAVHPFRDGNGRVGRLLMPLMMAADGYTPLYLSPYIASRKEDYYAALKAAQQKLEYSPLVEFLSEAVIRTVEELFATREALQALAVIWDGRYNYRKGSAAIKALGILTQYPVITIKRLAQIIGVSIPAATKAIELLVQTGILHEKTGYTRNRVYVATEVLQIINRPFGHEPIISS